MFIDRLEIGNIDLNRYKGIVALDFALNAGIAIEEFSKKDNPTRVQSGFIYKKTIKRKVGVYKNGNTKYKIVRKIKEPHWKLYNMLCEVFKDYLWIIEDLSNSMGAKGGGGTMLMNFGAIMAFVKMHNIDYTLTVPSHWKAVLGLNKQVKEFKALGKLKDKNFKPSDKDIKSFSLKMAKAKYETLSEQIGTDDNKADALLLLHWFHLMHKTQKDK